MWVRLGYNTYLTTMMAIYNFTIATIHSLTIFHIHLQILSGICLWQLLVSFPVRCEHCTCMALRKLSSLSVYSVIKLGVLTMFEKYIKRSSDPYFWSQRSAVQELRFLVVGLNNLLPERLDQSGILWEQRCRAASYQANISSLYVCMSISSRYIFTVDSYQAMDYLQGAVWAALAASCRKCLSRLRMYENLNTWHLIQLFLKYKNKSARMFWHFHFFCKCSPISSGQWKGPRVGRLFKVF